MRKLFLILVLLLIPTLNVYASSIDNIDMDIFVDDNGNAVITEIWDANVDQGTEGWHPYYNLGNSVISDVSVSMDGNNFDTISSWNEGASLGEKANKAGLYYPDSNEVDIVFGITSYGYHEYRITYRISNFVSTVEDADMIYWNLFPKNFSAEPRNVSISIYSEFKYDDTWEVWGYGKYGAPCYIYDGRIEMTSDGYISSNEYLTLLAKFPKGTFKTNNILDKNFDSYYQMAEDGAINYSDKHTVLNSVFEIVMNVVMVFVCFIPFVILFIIIMVASDDKKCNFGVTGNKVRKDVPNFRDIPCNKDIYRAYWIACNYNLVKKKEDFLGTILLKWIHDGNVKVEKITKNEMLKDKVKDNIIFVKAPVDGNELELRLYDYMYTASRDGKLESGEFNKWCSNNYSKIFKWFDDLIDFQTKMLVNERKIEYLEKKRLKIFKYHTYQVDSSMMEEAEQLAGLKKFLKEFTLIKEREPIEVNLWNEYLMYAQIFGIADEVAKQFKKLYPEVIADMDRVGYSYNDIIFIHAMSNHGMKSASDARTRAQSYSSGGGGFSSGGGGGGSFGGGGGGGGFR